jgi:cyclophilin family peptidyl-prolyl cis-trans isomerase
MARTNQIDLPGPLAVLANPKMFLVIGVFVVAAMMIALIPGALGTGTPGDVPQQMNELADVPRDAQGTPTASDTPTNPNATVKRYTAPPALTIDTSKRYLATVTTTEGDIQIELYPDQAPQAVNAFVFLAQDGYYNGTPFMQLVKNPDGTRFYAQAGDPTRTGLGTPGFSIAKEQTSLPFTRGAVGMGGSAENSNGGQFFISFGDYPALNGKYTVFGKVVGGQDVVDRLTLLDLTAGASATANSDAIQSVTITSQ